MENQDLVYYNAERFLQYFGSISDQSQALPLFFVALSLCLFAFKLLKPPSYAGYIKAY